MLQFTILLLLSILKLTSPIRQCILDAYNMSLGITKSTKLIENQINWLLWLVWVLFNTWWGYQKRVTRTKEINYAETSVIQLLWYQNSSGYAKFRINQMPQAFLGTYKKLAWNTTKTTQHPLLLSCCAIAIFNKRQFQIWLPYI